MAMVTMPVCSISSPLICLSGCWGTMSLALKDLV